jgi:hypothetical protein
VTDPSVSAPTAPATSGTKAMVTPASAGLPRDHLALLEARAYKSYMARMRASQRLASRGRAWNASLIALSTSTAIASIALLADDSMYGRGGPTLLVCVSVLTLVASLVTSGLDYSGRSRDMFLNYRRIQRLSAEAERAKDVSELHTREYVEGLNNQYDALLDESENHTEADHLRATRKGKWAWALWRERALSFGPYVSLALPVALLVPFVRWMLG